MQTQLSKLKTMMAAGDYRAALKLAAGWGQLGDHKARITRGWAAYNNAQFYRDIGRDPDALIADGIKAIRERYDIPEPQGAEQ